MIHFSIFCQAVEMDCVFCGAKVVSKLVNFVYEHDPRQLKIVSESADLAIAVVDFLMRETKGQVITGDTEHSFKANP